MGAEQKVAIITGASQGIGEALVRAYRDRNFCVVANSRSIKPSSDPDILAVAGDIGDPETAERIVSQALERFGRVDTLVNNAGIFIAKPFTEYTDEDYASMLAINLDGFFHITRRAAREMLKRGSGHIVQITTSLDEHADSSVPSALAALTKGGLNAATKSLAIEYASKGIRVNAVAPGAIKTPMHEPGHVRLPGQIASGRADGRGARCHRCGAVPRRRRLHHWRDPARRRRTECRTLGRAQCIAAIPTGLGLNQVKGSARRNCCSLPSSPGRLRSGQHCLGVAVA